MDGEDWDANFIAQLADGDDVDEAGGEDDMDVDEEPVSKFKSLSEVIKELDEIKRFFKIMDVLEKQVLSPLQWIWLHHFILHL